MSFVVEWTVEWSPTTLRVSAVRLVTKSNQLFAMQEGRVLVGLNVRAVLRL